MILEVSQWSSKLFSGLRRSFQSNSQSRSSNFHFDSEVRYKYEVEVVWHCRSHLETCEVVQWLSKLFGDDWRSCSAIFEAVLEKVPEVVLWVNQFEAIIDEADNQPVLLIDEDPGQGPHWFMSHHLCVHNW